MWDVDAYSVNSPGKQLVDYFINIAKPPIPCFILDVGAGAGAGSRELKSRGFHVQAFDITDAAWKHDDIKLTTGSIWRDMNFRTKFDFGYCCDVMEHIPQEFTALSVSEILRNCERAFLSISFGPDNCGVWIGQPLHLTVKPFTWWRDLMREVGTLHDARDLMGDGVFLVGR